MTTQQDAGPHTHTHTHTYMPRLEDLIIMISLKSKCMPCMSPSSNIEVTVTWTLNGKPIISDAHRTVLSDHSLQICGIQSSDLGAYAAIVSNAAGTSTIGKISTKNVTLSVIFLKFSLPFPLLHVVELSTEKTQGVVF